MHEIKGKQLSMTCKKNKFKIIQMGLINIMIPIPHTVLDEGGWRM
jgi:hypothetical protein